MHILCADKRLALLAVTMPDDSEQSRHDEHPQTDLLAMQATIDSSRSMDAYPRGADNHAFLWPSVC